MGARESERRENHHGRGEGKIFIGGTVPMGADTLNNSSTSASSTRGGKRGEMEDEGKITKAPVVQGKNAGKDAQKSVIRYDCKKWKGKSRKRKKYLPIAASAKQS